MLTLFELFGVAFFFIWCGNAVPNIKGTPFPHLFFSTTLMHMTTSTNCVQMEAKYFQHRFCLMKQNRHYLNALCHFGPCHANK